MARITRFLGVAGWYLCAILLLSAAPPALAQIVPQAIPANVKVIRFDGFAFPQQIAGLSRNQRSNYQVPGAGFSISYGKLGETWADIYIYDWQRDLTSDPPLALARREMEAAIDEIHAQIKRGRLRSVEIKDQSVSGSFTKARLIVAIPSEEFDSFVFITVRKGKFVKIRLSSKAGAASIGIAEKFLSEYARLLGKS